MYLYGRGFVRSHSSAIKWYRTSISQGNTDAYAGLYLTYVTVVFDVIGEALQGWFGSYLLPRLY